MYMILQESEKQWLGHQRIHQKEFGNSFQNTWKSLLGIYAAQVIRGVRGDCAQGTQPGDLFSVGATKKESKEKGKEKIGNCLK